MSPAEYCAAEDLLRSEINSAAEGEWIVVFTVEYSTIVK